MSERNRSSDARDLNRASATQLPNGSWIQWMCTGSGVISSRESISRWS